MQGYGEFIFLTFPKLTAMVAPFSSEKLGPSHPLYRRTLY